MCELFAMSSARPAAVNYSLTEFSKHGGLTRGNKDGWGICYYEDTDIRLIKEAQPASESPWVGFIAEQQLASDCVIAHVRMASRGHPSFVNTHPFERELGGHRHVFAHNGTMADIESKLELSGGRYRPMGETDSEYAFCVLLERLSSLWRGSPGVPKLEDRLTAVAAYAADVRRLGQSNFLYADGDVLFVHGHKRRYQQDDGSMGEPRSPGLHMLVSTPDRPIGEVACDGLKVAVDHPNATYFASVPLTDGPWAPIPEGDVLAIRTGREITRRPAQEGA